jgi:hypothetical protein
MYLRLPNLLYYVKDLKTQDGNWSPGIVFIAEKDAVP